MRTHQYRNLDHTLQEGVTTLLLRQLRPLDFSARCTAVVLLSCLLLAAAHRLSLTWRRVRSESSYRLLETGRGRTSSRDEGRRW